MDPFLFCGAIVILSPLIGYLVYRNVKATTSALLLRAAGLLALVYVVTLLSGNRMVGEEGDYLLLSAVFLLLNIALFQLLKLKSRSWIFSAFILLLCVSTVVVAFQIFVTGSYVFSLF